MLLAKSAAIGKTLSDAPRAARMLPSVIGGPAGCLVSFDYFVGAHKQRGGKFEAQPLAVLRFMMNSYLVTREKGISPGFAPLRISSIWAAACRPWGDRPPTSTYSRYG